MNFIDDGETELLATPEAEPAPAIPAAEIEKAVRAAGKGKKSTKKKSVAKAKKVAKKASSKPKTASKKKAAPKAAKASAKAGETKGGLPVKRPNALGKTGRKGLPESKRRRDGDAAFGKRVRKARQGLELAQHIVASKLGVTQAHVSNIETGTVKAGEELQAKLRKMLKF